MVKIKNKNLIIIIAAGLLIVGLAIYINQQEEKPLDERPLDERPLDERPLDEKSLENLAKCLTEKEVRFYGTYWCGFCVRQKEIFGEAAKYLPYIECAPDRATKEELAKCQEANITSVPDWRFPDKRQELGFQPLEQLAQLSGCPF